MSFEKLTSYVKNKTFHMKSTKWKSRNWKHRNTYPYKKRIDKEECSEISFWKSQNSYAKHKTIHTKINKFSYEINTSKNTNKKWTYHVHQLPLPNYLQKELSYEMAFTCISSGNSVPPWHIFIWKKGKVTSRKFSEMSFEKVNRNVKQKTFHMKSTSFHMKINNLKILAKWAYCVHPLPPPCKMSPKRSFVWKWHSPLIYTL